MEYEDNLLLTGPSERGAHRIMTALKCLRQYAFDRHLHASGAPRIIKGGALLRGEMVHLVLAHHYYHKAWDDKAVQLRACDHVFTERGKILQPLAALDEFVWRFPEGEMYTSDVRNIYAAYRARFINDSRWEVVGIENQIRVKIPGLAEDRALYTQRADLTVRDRQTSMYHYVDHKTAYEISNKTRNQYALHGQFLGYERLGNLSYPNQYGGTVLNRISVQKGTFDRAIIPQAPAAVADYVKNVRATEKLIEFAEQTFGDPTTDPRSWPGAFSEEVCYGKYGECQYSNTCRFSE